MENIEIKQCINCFAVMEYETKNCPECNTKMSYEIPKRYKNTTFKEIDELIRFELLKLEAYSKNQIHDELEYFNLKEAFAKLFFEVKKFENYSKQNRYLIQFYYNYFYGFLQHYDNEKFSERTYSNDNFTQMRNDMNFLINVQEYEFLIYFDTKEHSLEFISIEELKEVIPQPHQIEEKLSQKQIALIHAYTGVAITDNNKDEIAKKHGWTAKKSGHKIKLLFNKHYYRPSDRIGAESTKKKTENKIELIKSVINLLPTNKQQKAVDEIKTLKSVMDTEYL